MINEVLIKYMYERTLDDNSEDFLLIIDCISKLCGILMMKVIVTKKYYNEIFTDVLKRGKEKKNNE